MKSDDVGFGKKWPATFATEEVEQRRFADVGPPDKLDLRPGVLRKTFDG